MGEKQPQQQLSSKELQQLWQQFEGSPFEFWDLVYKQSPSNARTADLLLTHGIYQSFVDRILVAVGHPQRR